MSRSIMARFGGLIAVLFVVQLLAYPGAAFATPEQPNPNSGNVTAAQNLGYDVSFPQCGRSLPSRPGFAVLGVNGGLAFSGNSCLATEYAWAQAAFSTTQPHVSLYLNTGNPGPTVSTHWPASGTTAPRSCDGTWSASCSYDYGWYAAQDSFARATAVAGSAAAASMPWWLDVETANSWSTDTATNSADLQGAVDYLRSVHVTSIGIYAVASQWSQITGASTPGSSINDPFRSLPNWVPGARSAKDAATFCSRTFTGGRVKLVQYPSSSFDGDYACY